MIKIQKIIKYFAISIAILLTVNIISMIMFGIVTIGKIFDNKKENMDNLLELKITQNIKNIDIDIKTSNIIIKEGSSFNIETNNEYIKIKENNNKLNINEENHNIFKNNNSNLIIYIPTNYNLDETTIANGAGKINIENLITNKLELELGAGKVDINQLTVLQKAEIEGGAGEIDITNASIHNLDLDIGVGKVTIKSSLRGNNQINAGIGELNLNLIGTLEDYKIILENGIGTATLNNEKIKPNTDYGNGLNLIDIEGGIGAIKINLEKNNTL